MGRFLELGSVGIRPRVRSEPYSIAHGQASRGPRRHRHRHRYSVTPRAHTSTAQWRAGSCSARSNDCRRQRPLRRGPWTDGPRPRPSGRSHVRVVGRPLGAPSAVLAYRSLARTRSRCLPLLGARAGRRAQRPPTLPRARNNLAATSAQLVSDATQPRRHLPSSNGPELPDCRRSRPGTN